MALVKIGTVKNKVEMQESAYLNDPEVSPETKQKYTSCDNSEDGYRKKYNYLAQWNSKKKKRNKSGKSDMIDLTEIKNVFKELKKTVDKSDRRINAIILKEIENLNEHIATIEERKREEEKNRLLREREWIDRKLAELDGQS